MTREAMNLELMKICADTRATVLVITNSGPEAVLLSPWRLASRCCCETR